MCKFKINEDWLAVIISLGVIILILIIGLWTNYSTDLVSEVQQGSTLTTV